MIGDPMTYARRSQLANSGTRSVAIPVLEWLDSERPGTGRVAWIGPTGAYVDFDGFVLAVTAAGVQRMPNGVELTGALPQHVRLGAPARIFGDSLEVDNAPAVRLGADPWDPRPRRPISRAQAAGWGEAILRSLGVRPGGSSGSLASAIIRRSKLGDEPAAREGIAALLRWLSGKGEAEARVASSRLVGRGPGATPVGDDLLAGAAFADAVLDPLSASTHLLCPSDVDHRTTPLSATLLRLAVHGLVMETAARLLDVSGEGLASLESLARLGGSTGIAYALAIGSALASTRPAS